MESAAICAGMFHGCQQGGVSEETSVLDHEIDAGNVHMHNASGTDIEMSDFAVTHLAIRQANIVATGMDQRIRIIPEQSIISRFPGQRDGIGFGPGTVAPAVQDDEDERFWTHSR